MSSSRTKDATSKRKGTEGKSRKGREMPYRALQKRGTVLGRAESPDGKCLGIAFQVRHGDQRVLICPMTLTVNSNSGAFELWLIENHLDKILQTMSRAEVARGLRELAQNKKVLVISLPGFHRIATKNLSFAVYAWAGRVYHFGAKTPQDIHLVGQALERPQCAGTLESWNAACIPIVEANPRFVTAMCVGLSAAMRRALNEQPFSFGLVAETSQGKSTIQRAVSTLTGPPVVLSWYGTGTGIQERLAEHPDQPFCVDDTHLADKPEDVTQVVMAVGNGSARVRSRLSADGGNAQKIEATLIYSSEEPVASTIGGSFTGVLARCIEVHAAGNGYGMFEDLCGRTGGAGLSHDTDELGGQHHGTAWPKWLGLLERSWPRVTKWHAERLPKLRADIVEQAGDVELDALTGRLVDRLAFAAFVGCVATKLGLWSIKTKLIISAFALVLHEHVKRAPPGRNALAAAAIEAVRAHIEANPGKFRPLSSANEPDRQSGIAGYRCHFDDDQALILYIPDVFRRIFVEEFGDGIYGILRSAGHLVTSGTRHNLFEKKVRVGPDRARRSMFFIAIREEIRYARKSK